jgi:hypothetical protein
MGGSKAPLKAGGRRRINQNPKYLEEFYLHESTKRYEITTANYCG